MEYAIISAAIAESTLKAICVPSIVGDPFYPSTALNDGRDAMRPRLEQIEGSTEELADRA